MRSGLARLRRYLFGISTEETSFSRRGFRGGDRRIRERLERIGRGFLQGYHAALEEDRPDRLALELDTIDPDLRGFAFEGAGMGLYLLDLLTPWKRDRLGRFLAGPGGAHAYMVYVGAGWALAQLSQKVDRALTRFDPLLGWLAVDGYGFHQGYFRWPETVDGQWVPERLSGYARQVFDQGLGRSLWFVEGADVARIAATVATFPVARRPDLWSGVGLACGYAGGVDRDAIETLLIGARANRGELAQGAAFAAKARARAGIPSTHTDLACRVLCGMSAEDAAHETDVALADLPADGVLPAYEIWRRRIQGAFTKVHVDL